VPLGTALCKVNAIFEVIYDSLVAIGVPPFRGEVVLAASYNNPEVIGELERRLKFALFLVSEMNIATERSQRNPHVQLLFQVLSVSVQEMVGTLVALMDKRVVHIDALHVRVCLRERSNVRAIFKQAVGRSANIRLKLTRVSAVKVTNGSREHHDVAGTLK
jgi:hypothetical protein